MQKNFSIYRGGNKFTVVALHSTEALMAGFLKSSDLGPHPHSYGNPHHPHHSHGPPLPPGMPMSMTPFGLPHGLDAVGFPHQGMWGKYCVQFSILYIFIYLNYLCMTEQREFDTDSISLLSTISHDQREP